MGETILTTSASEKINNQFKTPDEVLREADIAERVYIGIGQMKGLGVNSAYSCADCGGGLWEIKTGRQSLPLSCGPCLYGNRFAGQHIASNYSMRSKELDVQIEHLRSVLFSTLTD